NHTQPPERRESGVRLGQHAKELPLFPFTQSLQHVEFFVSRSGTRHHAADCPSVPPRACFSRLLYDRGAAAVRFAVVLVPFAAPPNPGPPVPGGPGATRFLPPTRRAWLRLLAVERRGTRACIWPHPVSSRPRRMLRIRRYARPQAWPPVRARPARC